MIAFHFWNRLAAIRQSLYFIRCGTGNQWNRSCSAIL